MACKLIAIAGRAPVLETVLINAVSGAAINTATLVAIIRDSNNAPLIGETWPVTLTYVPGSNGVYRKQIDRDVNLVAGQEYTISFEAADASLAEPYSWSEPMIVAANACDAALPVTSPASTLYQAPDKTVLLREAEVAYHRLMMGGAVRVVVDQSGERVEYTAGNVARLGAYIAILKRELGLLPSGGPAGVYF